MTTTDNQNADSDSTRYPPDFLFCYREVQIEKHPRELLQIEGPADSATFLRQQLRNRPNEHVVALLLDTANVCVGGVLLGVGHSMGTLIDMKKLLRAICHTNAHAVILGHNHPASSLHFSDEDRMMTVMVAASCRLLGVQLYDHILIVTDGGEPPSLGYASMRYAQPELLNIELDYDTDLKSILVSTGG